MRIVACEEHEDCTLYGDTHVPKAAVDPALFPEWPPTEGEAERGVSDSVLFDALSTAIDRFATLDDALDRLGITVSTLEHEVKGNETNRKLLHTRLQDELKNLSRAMVKAGNDVDNLRKEVGDLRTLVQGAVVDATKKLDQMETRSRWVDQHADLWAEVRKLKAKVEHETEERVNNTRKLMRSLQNVRR